MRLVGGCCGTTPEHITQIKAALTSGSTARSPVAVATPAQAAPVVTTIPRAEKSYLANALARRRWVTVVELRAAARPRRAKRRSSRRARLRVKGVDAVLIPDGQTGPRLSALSLAVLIQQRTGIETVLQCSARDRSLLDLQSDLLGAHAMGVRNVVLVTGDVPLVGDYPDATAVVDVDSIGLLNAVSRFNHGTDVGGQSIGQPTAFHIGVTLNPGAEDLDREMRRFEYKLEAGADFVVTRPVFDRAIVRSRREAARTTRSCPCSSGFGRSTACSTQSGWRTRCRARRFRMACWIACGARKRAEAAAAEGIAIARDLYAGLKERVQGVLLTALLGRIDRALDILE